MFARRIGILLLLLQIVVGGVGAGQPVEVAKQTPPDPAESFVDANQAYDDGEYASAIGAYSQLIASGFEDGRLYYNLGNAYLRNGELGQAVASYRRGRILRPRDQDLLANMNFARITAQDAIEPPAPSALVATLLFWYYSLSPRELALSAVAVNLLFWVVVGGRIFRPMSEVLRWCSMMLLVLLIGTVGTLLARRWLSPPVAVVLPQEIDAYTGPDVDSVVRFKLHAGTEIRIGDRREGWLRIALPDGQQGWVESDWMAVVD